jgi:uncharacterized protein YbdZ (MbtH family)
VVINQEEQYSIWPADRENPQGWRDVGKQGRKQECLDYINEVWKECATTQSARANGKSCRLLNVLWLAFRRCSVSSSLEKVRVATGYGAQFQSACASKRIVSLRCALRKRNDAKLKCAVITRRKLLAKTPFSIRYRITLWPISSRRCFFFCLWMLNASCRGMRF